MASATTLAATPARPVLTPDGYGPLRIGMTRRQVIAALGSDRHPGERVSETCDQFHPRRAPVGMDVMIQDGRLSRISLSSPATVRTADGLVVGNRRSAVSARLGRTGLVSEHKYSAAPAGYIDHWRGKPGRSRGIRYEIETNNRVAMIHAGDASIELVEGCL